MPGLVPEWIVSAFAVATVFVVMFNLGLDIDPRDLVQAWGRPALMLKALFAVLVAAPLLAAALNSAPPGVKATILTSLVVTGLTVAPYAFWRSRYS